MRFSTRAKGPRAHLKRTSRPTPFLRGQRLFHLVKYAECECECDFGSATLAKFRAHPKLESLVPIRILRAIGGGIENDAMIRTLRAPTVMLDLHRSRVTRPVRSLDRGAVARAAIYVASIGPRARDIVDSWHIPIQTAVELDFENPPSASTRRRTRRVLDGQGAYVAREIRGGIVWMPVDPDGGTWLP